MHAIVTRVTVTDAEGATDYLRGEIVPRVSQAPASSLATGSDLRERTKEDRSSFSSPRTQPARRQTKCGQAWNRTLA